MGPTDKTKWKNTLDRWDDKLLEPLLAAIMLIIMLFATGALFDAFRMETVEVPVPVRVNPGSRDFGFTLPPGAGESSELFRVTGLTLADIKVDGQPLAPGNDRVLIDADLYIQAPVGLGWRLLWWWMNAAPFLALVGGLEMIRRMARAPHALFTPANARRLKWIKVFLIAALLFGLTRGTAQIALLDALDIGILAATGAFGPFFLALIVVGFLSRVWQRGIELQHDHELTI